MEYRRLGQTDLKVSVIGFGAWGIGGAPFWTTEGDTASERAILRAVDLGINLFDTAPVYGFGHSERLMGKALKPVRDRVILASKCGLRWEQEDLSGIRRNCSKESIMKEIDLSLQRLQTDCIDLYQVHWPDNKTSHEETMEALLDIQKDGKIRYFGVSNYSVKQIKASLKYAPLVSLQTEYNLLQRSIEKALIPFCLRHDMGLLAYSPLASGVLCGKYGKNTRFTDWRSKGVMGQFTGEGFAKNVDKVERLKELSEEIGRSCTHLAIHWASHQPGITSALVGVKNKEQMEYNVQAVGWQLEKTYHNKLEKIFSNREQFSPN